MENLPIFSPVEEFLPKCNTKGRNKKIKEVIKTQAKTQHLVVFGK